MKDYNRNQLDNCSDIKYIYHQMNSIDNVLSNLNN